MNIPLNAAMRGLESGVLFAGDNASNGQTLNELVKAGSQIDRAYAALQVDSSVEQNIALICESAIRMSKDFAAACKKLERKRPPLDRERTFWET